MARKFFAGTNSGRGFYSFYPHIRKESSNLIYYLKGGPGTGKSHFLKQLIKDLAEEATDLELFYCSSDPTSLDGLNLKNGLVTLIDATHPHVLEPQFLGARECFLNLGEFLRPITLRKNRHLIEDLQERKKAAYFDAYDAFEAARILSFPNKASLIKIPPKERQELKERLLNNSIKKQGQMRSLFCSALTPQGYVSYLANLATDFNEVWLFKGLSGSSELVLMLELALNNGYTLEAFYHPLEPHLMLHLAILELDLLLVTETHFTNNLDLEQRVIHCSDFSENKQESLIFSGVSSLQKASNYHHELEKIYQEAMDFPALDLLRQEVASEIRSCLGAF